jgi:hypothetical protein
MPIHRPPAAVRFAVAQTSAEIIWRELHLNLKMIIGSQLAVDEKTE